MPIRRPISKFFFVFCLIFFGHLFASSTTVTWTQFSPATSPVAVDSATMSYFPVSDTLILFGGFDSGTVNTTWSWDGTNWTQLSPATNPPQRFLATMSLDPNLTELILFGGFFAPPGPRLNDTWSWNGTNWTLLSPSTPPPARGGAVMALHPTTNNIILFGGDGNSGLLNDTWSWDGTNWTQLTPVNSPSARSMAVMDLDPTSGNLILFGGDNGGLLNDTWSWDGTDWTQLTPGTSPSGRRGAGMAQKPNTSELILFGGVAGGGPDNQTWSWDNTAVTWTLLTPIGSVPIPRHGPMMAFYASKGQLLLFGGHSFIFGELNDTWAILIPVISNLNPTGGPEAGGTAVTINGLNLDAVTSVTFGGSPAAFVLGTSTQMTATSPAGTGTVDVVVTNANGPSEIVPEDEFTYFPIPVVTSIFPTSGPTGGGTSVTINGTGFTGTTSVSFGGTGASFIVNSDISITATSPAHAAGTVDVTVTTPGGTSATSSADEFTYLPAPTVTNVSPNVGPTAGGTNVTITGTNFTGATDVSFGGTSASFIVNLDTTITATSPAHVAGTVDVTVTTPGGTSAISSADHFTYFTPPTISNVSPNAGPTAGGTSVTITGNGFTGTTAVTFGATPAASYIINSDNSITATSPAHVAGTVDITVTNPVATSPTTPADQFTYFLVPTVTGISPTSGPSTGGTSVTISGTNFTGTTQVLFGGTPAASFIVNSDSSITAVSPAHAAGTVDITVTTPGGTSATSPLDQFTFIQVTPSIFPPSHVKGFQIKNRFLIQTDIINVITWKNPSSGPRPVAYRVYGNAALTELLAVVSSHSGRMSYEQHNQNEDKTYLYYLVSVDAAGNQSTSARVKIQSN